MVRTGSNVQRGLIGTVLKGEVPIVLCAALSSPQLFNPTLLYNSWTDDDERNHEARNRRGIHAVSCGKSL